MPGINYAGADGKAAQAEILATLEFARPFDITNLNPLQGLGSQMMPMNVWVNPAYWPFAFFDKELASEISGIVAFICYSAACYAMARCFDLPRVPSIITAQFSIMLFEPVVRMLALRLTSFRFQGWPSSMRRICWPSACSRSFRPNGRRCCSLPAVCSAYCSIASTAIRYGPG